MTGPVKSEGRWWGAWHRLRTEESERLLDDLKDQVRGHFPPGTEVQRTYLSCYPRHALLRFIVPSEFGPREGYAFYAPGQIYPVDWTTTAIADFNDVALEIRGADQAEAFLRFAVWGTTADRERRFFVEDPGELNLEEPMSPDVEAALAGVLRPFRLVDSEPGDAEGSYRFQAATLHGGVVRPTEWVVDPAGGIQMYTEDDEAPVEVPVRPDVVQSDRYFALARETSLDAEQFVRRMRRGPVHQVRVTEPVVIQDEVFDAAVSLSQVTFEHGLDFGGSRFEKSLRVEQCVFEGRLNLRDVHVAGPLHAPGLWFHREGLRRAHGSLTKPTRYGSNLVDLDASGMTVEGSAYFEGLRCPNMADLSRIRVGGDLRLGGSRIGEPRAASLSPRIDFALRLDASEVEGDLDFVFSRSGQYTIDADDGDRVLDEQVRGFSRPLSVVGGTIWAPRLHVHGEVTMVGLRCEGNLALEGCKVGAGLTPGSHDPDLRMIVLGYLGATMAEVDGTVDVDGMYVGDDVLLYAAQIGGSIFGRTTATDRGRIPPVHIGGSLGLSGIRVNDVDFEGATIGSLDIITGDIGRVRIRAGRVEAGNLAGANERSNARHIREIPGQLGNVRVWDVTVRKRFRIQTAVQGDIRIGNLDCGGDLEFWSDLEREELHEGEVWAEGFPPAASELRPTVTGDLECTGVEVAGRLVLTNLASDGRIIFKNCRIAQDLNCQALGPDAALAKGRTTTECRHLDLELTHCGGDVDLAGLRVTGEAGSVHARQLKVEGRILLARALGDHSGRVDVTHTTPDSRVQAQVAGDLDLSVASTAQLVIAGSSVGGTVNLERGHFRRLDVIEPWLFKGHNLSDVQVDRWEVDEEHLRAFLDRSSPFARDTYVEIERVLRNKAQDFEADRVYRAMRARAIREARRDRDERRRAQVAPSPDGTESPNGEEALSTRVGSYVAYILRTFGSRLQGALYGWGTLYWAPLLVVSLFFVPLSWSLFSDPGNIVGTSDLVRSTPGATRASPPAAFDVAWGPSDGFWMTLGYHVPVVPLTGLDDFRPSPQAATLGLPGNREARFLFSTESYALVIYLLNWIVWPLFLVGLARRIVRETT